MRIVRTYKINSHKKSKSTDKSTSNFDSIQSKYDDQELRAMQRSPKPEKILSNLFCVYTDQLFWQHFNRK